MKKSMKVALACAVAVTGCGKSADVSTSDPNALTVSGSFSSVTGALVQGINRSYARSSLGSLGASAISSQVPAGYKVSCVTFTRPPQYSESAINADGTFSVNISEAKGKKMGCMVTDADGNEKATLVIKDSTQKTIDGKDKKSDSTAFNASANFGSLTLDLGKGEVEVPLTQIVSEAPSGDGVESDNSVATAYDFSGNYVIAALDFALPKGYEGPCATQDCQGPAINIPLYIKRINATSVATGAPVYGLQLWEGTQSSVEAACGTKLGLTSADATSLGIDISSYGSDIGSFSWSTSATVNGSTVSITNGWQLASATLAWDNMPDCGPYDVTLSDGVYHAWKCVDGSGNQQISLGGGCVLTGTTTPAQPTSWAGINSCTNSASTHTGYSTSSCSGTAPVGGVTQNVTCNNEFGLFDSSGNTTTTFDWSYIDGRKIASGTACSSGSLTALDQAKCYANAYYQSGLERASGVCLPRLHTAWTATTASAFVILDRKPSNLIFMEKLDYSDEETASFRSESDEFRGVQLQNNWVPCPVHSVGSGALIKLDAGKVLIKYVETQKATSSDEACVAAYPGSAKRFMFYMVKQ